MKRLIAAGSLLIAFAATPLHATEEANQSDLPKTCRKEVWRVYVPSDGPKGTWSMRSQKRTVLVCSQRVFAEIAGQMSSDSEKDGYR